MEELRYKLTVRREDILELYADQFEFRLFTKENSATLIYIGFFVTGLIFSIFNVFAYSDPKLPVIICSIAVAYNAMQLIRKYHTVRTNEQKINKWVDTFIHFKSHELVLSADGITYYRDRDIFFYDLTKIQRKQFDGSHFTLELTDGLDLLLPAKSFEDDKYGEFVDQVDVIIIRLRNRNEIPH